MQGDGEDTDSEGDQVPQGSPGQKDLLVNMVLQDLQDPSALKVISEYRGFPVPWVLEAHHAGQKGTKGEPGQSITAPSLLQSPVETTVNQSQTTIMKCSADGNPTPQITWSKMNSLLPVGRHKVESSGALVLKDVRTGDEGVYSCEARNLLGSVNATARVTVQGKATWSYLYIYKREFQLRISNYHWSSSLNF